MRSNVAWPICRLRMKSTEKVAQKTAIRGSKAAVQMVAAG